MCSNTQKCPPTIKRDVKKAFFKTCSAKSRRKINSFPRALPFNWSRSELCWKRKKFRKFRRWNFRFGILKTIATKNNWPELKKLFRREKQNLQEIIIKIRKSQLFSKKKSKNWKSWQKFYQTSISGVFFFILGSIL